MKIIKLKDFIAEGEKSFGKDRKKWQFICPSCKTKQSFEDFKNHTEVKSKDIQDYLGFSCIGRYTKEKIGCDWTLGGFLRIHELEVETLDGEKHPRFELADKS